MENSKHEMELEDGGKREDFNQREKLYTMSLETFFFTKRIMQHKETSNKITKTLASLLYDTISEINDFINKAEIEEDESEKANVNEIIPSVENSIIQAHRYYYCKICNMSVKGTSKSFHDHLYGSKHFKKLKEFSGKLDGDTKKLPMIDVAKDSSKVNMRSKIKETGSTQSLHSIEGPNLKTSEPLKKKERLNSLPARIKEIIPNENLPKKMKDFLLKTDLDAFTASLIREGQRVLASKKHTRVSEMLRKRLSCKYPDVKIYPFGSYVIGLGHEKADLDIFVDIEQCFCGKLTKRRMKDAIFQTQRILTNSNEPWSDFEPVIKARTPILRVFCQAEGIDCDLSFSNGLSTCNTKLIDYLINLQPLSRKITLFVKFWASKLNLGVNSYMLTLMVIFYLQQEGAFPSVKFLQDSAQPLMIDGWNSGFKSFKLPDLKLSLITDFKKYLIGFFKFYGFEFDYTNYIICVLTGTRVPKHIFDHGKEKSLPPVFANFAEYMSSIDLDEADEIEDLFANYKPIVIQDPFELIHNVSKGVQDQKLMKIINFMRSTHELLLNAKI